MDEPVSIHDQLRAEGGEPVVLVNVFHLAWAAFLAAHPEVGLDITVTDAEFDIVREGYDAGVRLGEVIEQDMIAVPRPRTRRQIPPPRA